MRTHALPLTKWVKKTHTAHLWLFAQQKVHREIGPIYQSEEKNFTPDLPESLQGPGLVHIYSCDY